MNTALIETWISENGPLGAQKLATSADIHLNTLNNIRSHKSSPGVDVARRLADALGVSLDVLVPGASDTNPSDVA